MTESLSSDTDKKMLLRDTNRIKLWTRLDGTPVSHFTLREFQSRSSFAVCVHPLTLLSLELLRRDLAEVEHEEVEIVITSGTRTEEDNKHLADRYGWTDEGGLVSRDSKHLVSWGGIAVDIVARTKRRRRPVKQATVGRCARQRFDYVKDDYADGHVHADNRHGGIKARQYRDLIEPAVTVSDTEAGPHP